MICFEKRVVIKRYSIRVSAEFLLELHFFFRRRRLSPGANLEQFFFWICVVCVSVQDDVYPQLCLGEEAGRISRME